MNTSVQKRSLKKRNPADPSPVSRRDSRLKQKSGHGARHIAPELDLVDPRPHTIVIRKTENARGRRTCYSWKRMHLWINVCEDIPVMGITLFLFRLEEILVCYHHRVQRNHQLLSETSSQSRHLGTRRVHLHNSENPFPFTLEQNRNGPTGAFLHPESLSLISNKILLIHNCYENEK